MKKQIIKIEFIIILLILIYSSAINASIIKNSSKEIKSDTNNYYEFFDVDVKIVGRYRSLIYAPRGTWDVNNYYIGSFYFVDLFVQGENIEKLNVYITNESGSELFSKRIINGQVALFEANGTFYKSQKKQIKIGLIPPYVSIKNCHVNDKIIIMGEEIEDIKKTNVKSYFKIHYDRIFKQICLF